MEQALGLELDQSAIGRGGGATIHRQATTEVVVDLMGPVLEEN